MCLYFIADDLLGSHHQYQLYNEQVTLWTFTLEQAILMVTLIALGLHMSNLFSVIYSTPRILDGGNAPHAERFAKSQ